ncbi:MAG: sensor histidine kinase [Bacillota bacterium]
MKRMLNINKTIAAILVSNMVHLAVVIGVLLYGYYLNNLNKIAPGFNKGYLLLYTVIFVTLFINSFIAVRNAISLSYTDDQYEMLKKTLCEAENLNKTLRAQRHDFMNHLQVVHGLMEMGEYNDALNYIGQIYDDIQKVNQVLKTSNPAVNALLQAKMLDCEKRSIIARLTVTSRLKELKVPSWEMCRVLGNIIDNAIYALKEKKGDRILEINIFEDLKSYGFLVKNNGPLIPKNIINKIFEAGFTTKGSSGEGMGLSITRDIIENYSGEISVKSTEESTAFEIRIPKG